MSNTHRGPVNVPTARITLQNDQAIRPDRDFILYWMIANRRGSHNFSLDRAIEHAVGLGKPLVILEALRVGYEWASDRLHTFIVEGMLDNFRELSGSSVTYLPYIEPEVGAGKELLEALAMRSCVVVTDDFPAFMLPRMVGAAAKRLDVALEAVDSNGLYPMRLAEKDFSRAFDFRRHLQKVLAPHLLEFPDPSPLVNLDLPRAVLPDLAAWPMATEERLANAREWVCDLPIDHGVQPVEARGGTKAARVKLAEFVNRFERYGEDRNHPDDDVASGLSPWLHFGHISSHEVFRTLLPDWEPSMISGQVNGARAGWWGLPDFAESYLDELVTWREIGFNMCVTRPDYDQYESLPGWALETLEEHAEDPRVELYTLEEFERAETHDPVWNAAQNQLLREGKIHNYLRMLWGKKILHWSESPRKALEIMVELNNKYALDGRDPNSYSGIFWVLGRYDRAWGPEREIFGKIRYMTSESAMSKLRMKEYVKRYGAAQGSLL